MSVILRRGDSMVLYCKGADNVIYDRLHGGQEDLKARTQDHLNVRELNDFPDPDLICGTLHLIEICRRRTTYFSAG